MICQITYKYVPRHICLLICALETDTTTEDFELTPDELEKTPFPKILKTALKRIESEVLSEESKKKSEESKVDIFNGEEYMPTDTVAVPIVVTLCVMTVYIFLGAIVFSQWEGWSIDDSGGFQLEFVSISWVINHMTCYKSSALIG